MDKPQNNALVARLILPTTAINIDGEKFTTLPPTLAGAMQAARTSGLRTERDEVKEIQSTPYIVSGSQSLSVIVQRKPVGDTAPPPTGVSPAPLPPAPSGDAPPLDSLSDGNDGSDVSALSSFNGPAVTDELSTVSGRLSSGALIEASTTTPGAAPAVPTAPPLPVAATPPGALSARPMPLKTVGRLASIWRQGTATDFSAGTLRNVSVASTGDVRLAASLSKVTETGETYLWALLPDGHGGVMRGRGTTAASTGSTPPAKRPHFQDGPARSDGAGAGSAGQRVCGNSPARRRIQGRS